MAHDPTPAEGPGPASWTVEDRIRPFIRETPLLSRWEESGVASGIHLKLESLQVTGSFKARGAAAAILALDADTLARGVVTCSSGNHGRAVAWMARRVGAPATVFLPRWVGRTKRAAILREGARVQEGGESYDEAESVARRWCLESGRTWIDAFDDHDVVAGQGTVGVEILRQLPDVETVLVPLSGGGLAGGVARALKSRRPDIRVVAVSARRARTMWESVRAGRPLEQPEEATLATALSGGIGLRNRITFDLVTRLVDDHLLVEEEAIRYAIGVAYRHLGLLVEGGGAVALAALLNHPDTGSGAPTWAPLPGPAPLVAVVSGGNLDPRDLGPILASSVGK